MVGKDSRPSDEIAAVGRRRGGLRRIETLGGRRFLIPDEPGNVRFFEPGAQLSEKDLEELEDGLARQAGLTYAYGLISRRDRSEHQLRDALRDVGIDKTAVIDYIVETLGRQGYLDDLKYAEGLIRYRKRYRPAGPSLVRRKLEEAGIAGEMIDSQLAKHYPAGEESRMALELAVGRLGKMKGTDRRRAARRIHGFLLRRGFSPGTAGGICAGILSGDISGVEDEQ